MLVDGIASARQAWIDAGRPGRPRIVAEGYFCLGPRADDVADHYLMHYYGQEFFAYARADTLTTPAALRTEVGRLSEAGCDDLLLFPCSGDVDQVTMLAEALEGTAPL